MVFFDSFYLVGSLPVFLSFSVRLIPGRAGDAEEAMWKERTEVDRLLRATGKEACGFKWSSKTAGRCTVSASDIVGPCCSLPPSPDMTGHFGGEKYYYSFTCVLRAVFIF